MSRKKTSCLLILLALVGVAGCRSLDTHDRLAKKHALSNEWGGLAASIRSLGGTTLSDQPLRLEHTLKNITNKPVIIHDLENSFLPELDAKAGIAEFVKKFAIDLLVPQNALTIPMNLPFGMALTEFIAETGIHTIAHHHDFYWERQRFMINAVQDILDAAFPPSLPSIRHVVINTPARRELAQRKGIAASLIPNVFDFDTEPPAMDEYARDLREQIGLKPEDILILQPTRLISRKGVEHAIELVRRLQEPRAKLVVSHSAGDEGLGYYQWLRDLAQSEGVDMRFVANRFSETRKFDEQGRKIYTLWDMYPHADLITYPSVYEGFGNAFLEAIYFRKPIVVNRYSVYMLDIEPLGFETVTMDGYVSDDVIEKVRHVLNDPELRKQMADRNFAIAKQHFSLAVLRRRLHNLIESAQHTPPGEF